LSHYQKHNVIIKDRNFRKEYYENSTQCLWLWDEEFYTVPNISHTTTSGTLVTMVADTKYTLFYALSPKQECN
jgi:hypothetical protein